MAAGGSRKKLGRWAVAVLLAVAASFLVARFVPSGGGSGGPPVDADLPTYGPEEAAEHRGEVARVCGVVESASYARQVGGRPTFLNLGRPYPDQLFTVVIWGEDRARFGGAPERRFRGRRICAAGRIRLHEGTPQIEVRRPDQVDVRRPDPVDVGAEDASPSGDRDDPPLDGPAGGGG